jgi:hypothetical protein
LRRAIWTARNRWRTLYRNFDETLLRRSFGSILRADLAHARQLGWKGILLLVSVWPRVLSERWRHREESSRLRVWPAPVPVEDR